MSDTMLGNYLSNLSGSEFRAENFNQLNRNCNTFSQHMSQILCGINIPNHVFNVTNACTQEIGPDLLSLNISNAESGINVSISEIVESGTMYPAMDVSSQNVQPVDEQAMCCAHSSCATTTEEFVNSIDTILQAENNNQTVENRVNLLQKLAHISITGDIVQLLKHHKTRNLMKYIETVAHKSYDEQKAIAAFICNLIQIINDMESRLWLFCHIREVVNVAEHCLLRPCVVLKDYGTSILYHLALKFGNELISEIVTELTSTLITFLSENPTEEHLYRSLTAISIFVMVSDDTVMLMKMFGQVYLSFGGISDRCDQLIRQIAQNVP